MPALLKYGAIGLFYSDKEPLYQKMFMAKLVRHLPYHVIMLLCHPSLRNRKICHPRATLCLPRVKLSAHGPHYAALSLHYASLGPPALWQHNANLGQHNVSLGRHIFPYPSGRGGILYQCGRRLVGAFLVAGVVDLGDVERLLGVLALEVVLALAERTGLFALDLLGAAP